MRFFLAFLFCLSSAAFGLDVNGQLKNAQLEKVTSDPSGCTSTEARIAYDTDDDLFRYCNGTAWLSVADLSSIQTFTNKRLTSPKLNEDVALTTTSTKLNYLTSVTGTTGTTSTNVVFSTSPQLTSPHLNEAVALTSTSTKLNYLTSAAGTTGTSSTNIVYSTSPVVTTPTVRTNLLLQNSSGSQPELLLSEDPDNGTNTVTIKANASIADYILTLPVDDGANGELLSTNGSGVLSWTAPLTNPMDSDGDMIYGGSSGAASKLDSGTAGEWLVSGGAGIPDWTNTVTTAKVIDGSADAVQLTVQGHSTQTNQILLVEKSDGTDLLEVTNTTGTKIKGTTGSTAAASGLVGEVLECNDTNFATTTDWFHACSFTLTAGIYTCSAQVYFNRNTATFSAVDLAIGISNYSGTTTTGLTVGITYLETDSAISTTFGRFSLAMAPLLVRSDGTNTVINGVSTATQTLYFKVLAGGHSGADPIYNGRMLCTRVY